MNRDNISRAIFTLLTIMYSFFLAASFKQEFGKTKMQEISTLILLLPLLAHSVHINNEYCRPRPTLVPIDNPNFKYFPYIVKLNRCGGSCDSTQPSVKSCIPLQYREVNVTVQEVGTNTITTITERNHTQCGCECVVRPEDCNFHLEEWRPDLCQCKCKYGDTPPTPCKNGFTWSKRDCRCVCNRQPQTCPPNKVWSSKECGCICKERKYRTCAIQQKIVNQETCRCRKQKAPETSDVYAPKPQEKGGFRQEFYIALFVGQFAFMYLVFDAILFRKKAGLIYRLTRNCSSKKAGNHHSNMESSREDIFSDSNSTVVTDLPSDIGQQNTVASDVSSSDV